MSMTQFYVKIEEIGGKYYVQFWYNTDLRADDTFDDLPVKKILDWLK